MERIYIMKRTTKKSGTIKLRFRLRDGKAVDIQHRSDIKADIKHLEQFDIDGKVKSGKKVFNEELRDDIAREIAAMSQAYKVMKEKGLTLNNDTLNTQVDLILNPQAERSSLSIDSRFEQFIDTKCKKNGIGVGRLRHYEVLLRELRRFLIIKHKKNITAGEFNEETLQAFSDFLINEYKYVWDYPSLYEDQKEINVPKQARMKSTVSTKLKILRAFFTSLENKEEITRSPFRSMDKEDKTQLLFAQYDVPVFLEADEFNRVLNSEVSERLQECKDIFLINAAIGCRIGDLVNMGWKNVGVKNGIPYIHYLPAKTARRQSDNSEIQTPIMRFAFDILKSHDFIFPLLKNVSGKSGYNKLLKELLEQCEISRECPVLNHETGRNEYVPLYELASSKLARKTHVDMTAKVQINLYASGLHKEGSAAVKRYTNMGISDKFKLLNAAFSQPFYKVNNDLEIISEGKEKTDKDLNKMLDSMSDSDKARLLEMLLKKK